MVKNLPANAGDTSSIPSRGRFHMLWTNKDRVPKLPKPKCLEAALCNNRNHGSEKPVRQDQIAALLATKRKFTPSNEDSAQPKRN